MSEDIWHKAGFHEAIDDKLKVSKDGKWVYWTMYGWNIPGKDAHDIGCEWAYLDDLLELETELERTRKALGIAMGFIEKVRNNEDTHMFWIKVANDTINKITALKQKDK